MAYFPRSPHRLKISKTPHGGNLLIFGLTAPEVSVKGA